MRSLLTAAICAFAIACGGSNGNPNPGGNPGGNPGPTDYAPGFVGTYVGTQHYVLDGPGGTQQQGSAAYTYPVETTGTNRLHFPQFCDSSSLGPTATTSATGFNFNPGFSCVYTTSSCAAVTLVLSSGSGAVSGKQLTMNAQGQIYACGSSSVLTMTFTGTTN
jgi:hypothetical protein